MREPTRLCPAAKERIMRIASGLNCRTSNVVGVLAAAFLSLAVIGGPLGQAGAEAPEISDGRRAERTDFTDLEIRDGFFKIAFGAELQVGPHTDRIRKFDGPVRVYVANHGKPDRRADLAAILADLRSRIAHLDLATTTDRKAANVVVTLVSARDFK